MEGRWVKRKTWEIRRESEKGENCLELVNDNDSWTTSNVISPPIPLDRFLPNAFQLINNPFREIRNNWIPHANISGTKVVRIKMKLLICQGIVKNQSGWGESQSTYLWIRTVTKDQNYSLKQQPLKFLIQKISIPKTVHSTLDWYHICYWSLNALVINPVAKDYGFQITNGIFLICLYPVPWFQCHMCFPL